MRNVLVVVARVMVLALPSRMIGVVMRGSPVGPFTPSLPWLAVGV
jgi:hypothetical protein